MDQSNGIINVETFVNSQKQSNEIITIEEPEEQKAEEVEENQISKIQIFKHHPIVLVPNRSIKRKKSDAL